MFEKLIFDYVYEHPSENGLLVPHQWGIRRGDSTVNQLLAITHKIYYVSDDIPSKETRAVFGDLRPLYRAWSVQT